MVEKGGRCAIFSCKGLGDGLLSLVLSNNLKQNGFLPVTFHPFLEGLQSWFPDLPIRAFPKAEDISSCLEGVDRIFLFLEKSDHMQAILSECLCRFRKKTTILNPIATPNQDYPYWEEARFDGRLSFVENLYRFSKEILHLPAPTRKNGIQPPSTLSPHRYPKRVVIHPTSSRKGKNWDERKFAKLSDMLIREGWIPAFILTEEERRAWQAHHAETPSWDTLEELASYVYQSGLMVGNDSGIGHLASCLGLPTVVICRSRMASDFWRPSWSKGIVLTPPSWLPNLKGLRLRDKHWQKWVSVNRVVKACQTISTS